MLEYASLAWHYSLTSKENDKIDIKNFGFPIYENYLEICRVEQKQATLKNCLQDEIAYARTSFLFCF